MTAHRGASHRRRKSLTNPRHPHIALPNRRNVVKGAHARQASALRGLPMSRGSQAMHEARRVQKHFNPDAP